MTTPTPVLAAQASARARGDLLLEVDDLRTVFHTARGDVAAVDGVTLRLHAGETLGIVGESGSGKSVLGRTVMGLVSSDPTTTVSGSVRLDGQDVHSLSPRERRRLWGPKVAMVFQDPMTSLNPVKKIGAHLTEPLRLHRGLDRKDAREQAARPLAASGDSRAHATPQPVPPRALRRHAPARRHRDGALLQPRAAHRRRADHRARRHRPEADPGPAGRTLGRAPHGGDPDQPRPRRCGRPHRPGRGDVRRPGRRDRPDDGGLRTPPAPLLRGAPRIHPASWTPRPTPCCVRSRVARPTWQHPRPGCRFAPRCPQAQERCRTEPPLLRDPRPTPTDPPHLAACHFPLLDRGGLMTDGGRRRTRRNLPPSPCWTFATSWSSSPWAADRRCTPSPGSTSQLHAGGDARNPRRVRLRKVHRRSRDDAAPAADQRVRALRRP